MLIFESKKDFFQESLDHIDFYITSNRYLGWDPYDGLTTELYFINKSYIFRLLFTYFNKFSPINCRNLFRIYRKEFTQTYMFLGLSKIELGRYSEAEIFLKKILLDSKYSKFGYHCWDGVDMPIQMRNCYKEKIAPSVISTELAARFILNYLKATEIKTQSLIDVLISVNTYLNQYMLTNYDDLLHFKYYDTSPNELFVFNANANTCAFLAELDMFNNSASNKDIVYKVISSVIKYQQNDGRWNYSVNLKTGIQKKQVDFHQGFILDSILRILNAYGDDLTLKKSYQRGLDFYMKNQFLPSGQGIYRYPKKWPVNIHNQAQGIITFTRAAEAGFGNKYMEFARTIAEWTINNMQDPDGHFYYMKYPIFTNKIPYIRWSDASMALALSVFIRVEKGF